MLRRLTGELIGTAGLLIAVVGSGIMAERLAGGNVAIALLTNSIATGAALLALILAFAHVSGAHLNPVVTLVDAMDGGIGWGHAGLYVVTQFAGALIGTALANAMFSLPIFFISSKPHTGMGLWLGEFIATLGLIAVIIACNRKYKSTAVVAVSVAAYITAAYWFTSSTSFANPAVTVARSVTDTFAGIRPFDVPGFVVAQVLGG